MQVSKWGNSLAIRIPSSVVETLHLKEGDDIEVHVADARTFEIARDDRRTDAIEALRKLRWKMPEGFKFNREEANER